MERSYRSRVEEASGGENGEGRFGGEEVRLERRESLPRQKVVSASVLQVGERARGVGGREERENGGRREAGAGGGVEAEY